MPPVTPSAPLEKHERALAVARVGAASMGAPRMAGLHSAPRAVPREDVVAQVLLNENPNFVSTYAPWVKESLGTEEYTETPGEFYSLPGALELRGGLIFNAQVVQEIDLTGQDTPRVVTIDYKTRGDGSTGYTAVKVEAIETGEFLGADGETWGMDSTAEPAQLLATTSLLWQNYRHSFTVPDGVDTIKVYIRNHGVGSPYRSWVDDFYIFTSKDLTVGRIPFTDEDAADTTWTEED